MESELEMVDPKVCIVLNNFKVVPINGDGWRGVCILRHDIRLLQTDGQSELFTGVEEAT